MNTTSASGVFGNVGQSNYGAAKAGIAAFTIITAMELARYGVTVNAVAPRALTAMTERLPRYQELAAEPGGAERISPSHISPVVVWLASPLSAQVTGRVFGVAGTTISVSTRAGTTARQYLAMAGSGIRSTWPSCCPGWSGGTTRMRT